MRRPSPQDGVVQDRIIRLASPPDGIIRTGSPSLAIRPGMASPFSPGLSLAIRPGARPHGVSNATISASGSIQERILPLRTGNELARTVAVRRTHQPSHYAMLGVARNFTEAQLKRQHRLLSLRFHPDAAERNGVDPEQAAERFKAMQTAYEVLREPGRRARYDVEMRLQRQRLWRGAWSAPHMQIVDKTGTPPTGAAGPAAASAEAACGGGAESAAGSESLVTAKLRALQAEERANGSHTNIRRLVGRRQGGAARASPVTAAAVAAAATLPASRVKSWPTANVLAASNGGVGGALRSVSARPVGCCPDASPVGRAPQGGRARSRECTQLAR